MQNPAYLTWKDGDEEGKAKALSLYQSGISDRGVVYRTRGSDIYVDVAPNGVSVRDEFSREDYEDFRPGEALPRKPKDKIRCCMKAYSKHGLVRNIIDVMADFACAGIDLSHPDEDTQIFCKEWFRRVNGVGRSERFLNILYRCANVIVRRVTGYLPLRESRDMKGGVAIATPDVDLGQREVYQPSRREIPWRYYFFNPLSINLIDDELTTFVGEEGYLYGLTIPETLASKIVYPSTEAHVQLISRLPPEVVASVKAGQRFLLLDPNRVRGYYYKKDDWQAWAEPMLLPVLTNLNQLEKMQLADMAALDGAISSIRVWRLGSIEEGIVPSPETVQRLAEMLANNVGGGVMDLVWGPDIDLVETNTDIHQFLGSSKYEPVLNLIYQGLGIPPSLAGAGVGSTGGVSNNYFSLKTLIERLQYGRTVLSAFWEHEVRLLAQAMDFTPPSVVYDRMSLDDETAEKKLLMDLADRDLISWEYLIERFGGTPEIEQMRLEREARRRKDKKMPEKAGPFHKTQQDFDLKKIYAQSGTYAPSEMGLELEEKKPGEITPADENIRLAKEKPAPAGKPPGQPGQGRPLNSKDKDKRKKRKVQPRRTAGFVRDLAVAERTYNDISRLLSGAYLSRAEKNTLRELSQAETDELEGLKASALWNWPFGEAVTPERLTEVLTSPLSTLEAAEAVYSQSVAMWTESRGEGPPVEVTRRFRTSVYALFKGKETSSGES